MRKKLIIILILISAIGSLPFNFSNAADITTRLKGKILLQVESKGEAWYVNPITGKRHYMADGNAAYSIMRELGIGITNKELEKIKTNKVYAKKYSGKIFLQVESHGEAYYIDFNGNSHYLKDGPAAYSIMRKLGLGIKNSDLNTITTSDSYVINSKTKKSKLTKDNAYKAVVRITCVNEGLSMIKGSGIIISPDGKIITNAHVVTDIDNIFSGRYDCFGCIPTKINSYDPDYCFNLSMFQKNTTNDLAFGVIQNKFDYQRYILINNVKDMTEYPFLNIELNKKVGDAIYAIGYPTIANGSANITKGAVTSKTKVSDYDFFISDVGVSYGNSGGAVINESGKLIGLATQVNQDELMSLTYILDLNSLKTEYNFYKKVRQANSHDTLNFDKSIYFIEDVYTINDIKF